MARNKYEGYCYKCGTYVPVGFGHFERQKGSLNPKWRVKCVKCTSGRNVQNSDKEVIRAKQAREVRGDKDD